MSDLSFIEKSKFEKLLGMGSGYVLEFSNRTFSEFIMDSVRLNIYDSRYDYASGSKANRLRAFWQKEENAVVGKLMRDMLDFINQSGELERQCRQIVARLEKGLLVFNAPCVVTCMTNQSREVVELQLKNMEKSGYITIFSSSSFCGHLCAITECGIEWIRAEEYKQDSVAQ